MPFSVGGGSGPTSSTVTQTNLPEYLEPYVMGMMGQATQQLFQTAYDPTTGTYSVGAPRPYTPWSPTGQYINAQGQTVAAPGSTLGEARQYVAQPTGIQQNALGLANWLGTSGYDAAGNPLGGMSLIDLDYGRAGQFAESSGYGGQYAAQQAFGSGQRAADIAKLGLGIAGEGGAYYGGLGAGYGTEAARLAPQAQLYGDLASQIGTGAEQLARQTGGYYGGLGAGYGGAAVGLSPEAQAYGRLASQIGTGAEQLARQTGGYYGGLGAGYGGAAAQLSPEAQIYGRTAADIGQMGLRAEELGRQIGTVGAGYGARAADVGGLYERMATSPSDVERFMSPYQQAVIEQQKSGAIRQADIAEQQRKAAAARAGAYGGARQAIESAEANRNLQAQLQGIEAMGLQQAYQQAQQNIQQRAQLELQGLTGAQQGLGTALQGGQLGLSGIGQAMAGQQAGLAGLGQAGQLYGLGMQGAGMGLQGLQQQLAGAQAGMQGAGLGLQGIGQAGQMYGLGMQGAGMGLQGLQQQLAGSAQALAAQQAALQGIGQAGQMYGLGMQGAGMGLQGVQQQLAGVGMGLQGEGLGLQGIQAALGGYGLAGQAGRTLADITGSRIGQYGNIISTQYGLGEQQRALEQQAINQAIQNFAMAQETPYQRLAAYNALMRGYSTPGQTMTQYQSAPSGISQLAGVGLAGAGLSGLMGKKAGGTVKARDGVDKLALNRALQGG